MSEKQIENSILEFLTWKKIFCWKNQTTGVFDPVKKQFRKSWNQYHLKGVADILGILPDGRFLAIEVKAPKKYPTKEQREFIKFINDKNGLAFVARSIEDVEDNLSVYLNDALVCKAI